MNQSTWKRSCADSGNELANTTSLHNINPDGAFDGTQRSLEDFQFDLENMLTMSQLVGKSAEERNAASVMLDILANTRNKAAAEVAVEIVRSDRKQWKKGAVRCACSKHCQTSQSDCA